MSNHEHSWAPISTHKQPRAAMSVSDYHWTLMSSHEHSWAWCHGAMSTHQSTRAIMSMAPRGYERSIALRSAHGTIAPYSWVLLGTHGHTWALREAHEHSWQVMSTELFDQTINKKCLVLEWPQCIIFTIYHSIFNQLIKNWIFLKSTQNGRLKNVQYRISRPLGSREIQKNKSG